MRPRVVAGFRSSRFGREVRGMISTIPKAATYTMPRVCTHGRIGVELRKRPRRPSKRGAGNDCRAALSATNGPTECVTTPPTLATHGGLTTMSDRPDSTPQPPHPEEDVFRETFLLRLNDPKKVDTFLALGDLLMEYLNELHQWGTSEKETATAIQLRAASCRLTPGERIPRERGGGTRTALAAGARGLAGPQGRQVGSEGGEGRGFDREGAG